MKKEKREIIHKKYNGHCAYCGKKITYKQMQVDHIRAKSIFNYGIKNEIPNYDVDDIRNLNPSCRRCNYHKHKLTIEEFRKIIAYKIKICNDHYFYKIARDYKLIKETNNTVLFHFEKNNSQQI